LRLEWEKRKKSLKGEVIITRNPEWKDTKKTDDEKKTTQSEDAVEIPEVESEGTKGWGWIRQDWKGSR